MPGFLIQPSAQHTDAVFDSKALDVSAIKARAQALVSEIELKDDRLKDLDLYSQSGPVAQGTVAWLEPTNFKETTIEDIRAKFVRDGYVFLKGILPKEDVLEARRKFFELVSPTGILKEGTDPVEGIYAGGNSNRFYDPGSIQPIGQTYTEAEKKARQQYLEYIFEAHRAEWYQKISNHPVLVKFIKDFTGWNKALLLQRQMLRSNVPGNQRCTGVHYDQIFIRGGPPTSMTVWLPIGGVSVKGGGLAYLEHGSNVGEAFERDFAERASSFTEEEKMSAFNANMARTGMLDEDAAHFSQDFAQGHRWLVANYEAGDIVIHSPFMVHSSMRNEDPENRIRLATDLRFVNPEEPFDGRWMKYWEPQDGL